MKRRTPKHSADQVDGAISQDTGEPRSLGRRGLLTTGGAMVVGAAAAGVAVAATSSPANAATGDPVLAGGAVTITTNAATEIDATNNPTTTTATPTLILSNSGGIQPTSTAPGQASPPLRVTTAASNLTVPATATVGGDIVATGDGNLWFTHKVPDSTSSTGFDTFPAIVHTDANSNSFAPLAAPVRVLDTRSAALRANIIDASGNLDSSGRLKAGHTIHINLTSLVFLGDAVTANLTVTGGLGGGFLTMWSGTVALPNASSINYVKSETIANLSTVGIGEFTSGSTTFTDTVAIACTDQNTHVILDVTGFFVADFAQVNPANLGAAMRSSSTTRAQRVMQARAHFKA